MERLEPEVDITLGLLERYDKPGPRYTSYPTAVELGSDFTEQSYRAKLAEADTRSNEPLSLYIHLPFCAARCSYCGCNVVITKKKRILAEYLERLHREIDLVAAHLPNRRRVSQLHWGGGTPTYLGLAEMEALYRKITEHFVIEPDAEVAIEVDPRVTSREQVRLLRRLGFNRISIGVQDFTPEVQEAIDRNQSEAETRELYGYCRELGFDSINLDLIYGLPKQTPEAFTRSMQTVLDLRPDRLAIYSYAFVPWLKAHQKRMDVEAMPGPREKLQLFSIARSTLLAAGYAPIGMDHFALPDDELVRAMKQGRLKRNFMGYTVAMGSDMIGLGTSAIGDVRGAMAQNEKKLPRYYQALDAGEFPIEKGLQRDEDDEIRRHVIVQLMCNFSLDCKAVEDRFGIDFATYFADELQELRAPDGAVQHGFLRIDPDGLEVVGHGRLFVRNICMAFDRHMREKRSESPVFSRTV